MCAFRYIIKGFSWSLLFEWEITSFLKNYVARGSRFSQCALQLSVTCYKVSFYAINYFEFHAVPLMTNVPSFASNVKHISVSCFNDNIKNYHTCLVVNLPLSTLVFHCCYSNTQNVIMLSTRWQNILLIFYTKSSNSSYVMGSNTTRVICLWYLFTGLGKVLSIYRARYTSVYIWVKSKMNILVWSLVLKKINNNKASLLAVSLHKQARN